MITIWISRTEEYNSDDAHDLHYSTMQVAKDATMALVKDDYNSEADEATLAWGAQYARLEWRDEYVTEYMGHVFEQPVFERSRLYLVRGYLYEATKTHPAMGQEISDPFCNVIEEDKLFESVDEVIQTGN